MTKIAFMFPGQGSFAAGMGKDIAEAVPAAMAVYDEASDASGCTSYENHGLLPTEYQSRMRACRSSRGKKRGTERYRQQECRGSSELR